MTQEDKKLLLKDLSARQLYKVVLFCKDDNEDIRIGRMTDFCCDLPYTPTIWIVDNKNNLPYEYRPTYEIVRPYLRPMSSMTEEEREELLNLLFDKEAKYFYIDEEGFIDGKTSDLMKEGLNYPSFCPINIVLYTDWLNAHHFDYRGLIKKGLALEAPADMYK